MVLKVKPTTMDIKMMLILFITMIAWMCIITKEFSYTMIIIFAVISAIVSSVCILCIKSHIYFDSYKFWRYWNGKR